MIRYLTVIFFISILFSCSSKTTRIEGGWNLYLNKFINSEKLNVEADSELVFPGSFIDTLYNNSHTYGSIRKSISVIPGKKYSIYISGINSASKIWIDDNVVGEFGRIGKSIDEVKPLVQPTLIQFSSENDRVDITIEFSNFHLREDLLFKWMLIGDRGDILNLYIKHQSKDYFSSGILLIIALLFFLLFVTNPGIRYCLYFSLFSLSYGIRSFLMEKVTVEFLLPVPWELIYQLTKASELWALVFILLFFKELYPKELRNRVTTILVTISAIFSFSPFIPLDIFSTYKFMFLFHFLVLFTGNYFLMRLFQSVRKKRVLAKLTFISLLSFSISTVVDILSNRYVIPWAYISAQAVILLVITMCILIAKERTVKITEIKEKQDKNLKFRNTFSKFVPLEILSLLGNRGLEDRGPGDYLVNPQTIAYIDIRDFTKLSQGLTPEENFIMINNFFKLVGSVVSKSGGFIESYGGDGVKVVFPVSPDSAINAAMQISEKISLNQSLRIGISIHVGNVVLGTIGSENRMQTTSISNITRIISKMDHFNSKMDIEILITENVLLLSKIPKEKFLPLGCIKLKNEDEPITLFQVLPSHIKIDPLFIKTFNNGLSMLKLRKFSRALGYFQLAHRYDPSHRLTQYYITQIEEFLNLKHTNFTLTL